MAWLVAAGRMRNKRNERINHRKLIKSFCQIVNIRSKEAYDKDNDVLICLSVTKIFTLVLRKNTQPKVRKKLNKRDLSLEQYSNRTTSFFGLALVEQFISILV